MSTNTGVGAGQRHGVRRGGEGERRDDDLVAGSDAGGEQPQVQRRRARVHRDAVPVADDRGELGLERGDLGTGGEHPAGQHAVDGGALLRPDHRSGDRDHAGHAGASERSAEGGSAGTRHGTAGSRPPGRRALGSAEEPGQHLRRAGAVVHLARVRQPGLRDRAVVVAVVEDLLQHGDHVVGSGLDDRQLAGHALAHPVGDVRDDEPSGEHALHRHDAVEPQQELVEHDVRVAHDRRHLLGWDGLQPAVLDEPAVRHLPAAGRRRGGCP